MTVNEHVLGLVAMAVAILAILTVGTLIGADIIRLGAHRAVPAPETQGDRPRPTKRSDVPPGPTTRPAKQRTGGPRTPA